MQCLTTVAFDAVWFALNQAAPCQTPNPSALLASGVSAFYKHPYSLTGRRVIVVAHESTVRRRNETLCFGLCGLQDRCQHDRPEVFLVGSGQLSSWVAGLLLTRYGLGQLKRIISERLTSRKNCRT